MSRKSKPRNRVKPSSIRPKLKTKAVPKARVIKSKNGKLSTVKACVGVDSKALARKPDLRIGREWHHEIRGNLVYLVFLSRSVRVRPDIFNNEILIGEITTDHSFQRNTKLSDQVWADIALRMYGDSNKVDPVLQAARSAVRKHLIGHYDRCPDKSRIVQFTAKI